MLSQICKMQISSEWHSQSASYTPCKSTPILFSFVTGNYKISRWWCLMRKIWKVARFGLVLWSSHTIETTEDDGARAHCVAKHDSVVLVPRLRRVGNWFGSFNLTKIAQQLGSKRKRRDGHFDDRRSRGENKWPLMVVICRNGTALGSQE